MRKVVVTDDARRDIKAIYDYIADTGSPMQASRIADRLLKLAASLAEFPERGSHPGGLVELGNFRFRQIVLKPWLVIYGVEDTRIVVYLVAGGRRDMQTLLAQRLLSAGE